MHKGSIHLLSPVLDVREPFISPYLAAIDLEPLLDGVDRCSF